MRALYLATVANRVMPASTPRSCRRSSTLRSESGKRTYSITAKRMISGLVLKYLKGECFVIWQRQLLPRIFQAVEHLLVQKLVPEAAIE